MKIPAILMAFVLAGCYGIIDDGFDPVPEDLYDYLDVRADTIVLIDADSNLHELINYKQQTIRQNGIVEYEEHAEQRYIEYEKFCTYFESEKIMLAITLQSYPNSYYSNYYVKYDFIINEEDTMNFLYYFLDYYDDYMDESIITITGTGSYGNYSGQKYPRELLIKKHIGMIALYTFRGDTFYVAGLPEEYYPD